MIRAIVDHKIRLWLRDLPEDVIENLAEAFSIPNLEKEEAQRFDVPGWRSMPDTIDLWKIHGSFLVLPRGCREDLERGLSLWGQELVIGRERRRWTPLPQMGSQTLRLRPWQEQQLGAILERRDGIIQSPAGSGKTVTVLAAIEHLSCPALVIVNTKDILWQWRERAREHLGPDYPVGQIGDNTFEVSPYLTIATAQTLHRRFESLEKEGFFDRFSFVCLDECHHATADTYHRILDRFSAQFRIGVSATPEKTGNFLLAETVLGPVLHRTKPAEVSTLEKPQVVRVPTEFRYAFQPHRGPGRRSNYPAMVQALITDPDRNQLIIDSIYRNAGRHQLVVSKRLEHLSLIAQGLEDMGFPDPIVTIIGADDSLHRQQAKALAETSPCVILSTLADEAMDIPRLDRLHLPFPQRNTGLIQQQVGRAERRHPDKVDSIVYDYVDYHVSVLRGQWNARRMEVYMRRGYKISTYA